MTEEEVDEELKKLKKQNFKTEAEFQEFLKTSHYTTQDVNERVKIQILSDKNPGTARRRRRRTEQVRNRGLLRRSEGDPVHDAPDRDVRILIAKTGKTRRRRRRLSSRTTRPTSWKKVVKKYSESAVAERRPAAGVTEEQYAGEVGEAMFSAPPRQGRRAGQIRDQRLRRLRSRESEPGESPAARRSRSADQSPAPAADPGSGLRQVRRRLPEPLALADLLRRRLRRRKMRQLQERRPPGRSRPGLLRSEPENRARSLSRRPSARPNRRCRARSA